MGQMSPASGPPCPLAVGVGPGGHAEPSCRCTTRVRARASPARPALPPGCPLQSAFLTPARRSGRLERSVLGAPPAPPPGAPGHPAARTPCIRSRAGITRSGLHKRRATGGRRPHWRKAKKYELGRQPANTKLSSNVSVRPLRVRGGNRKFRALRLDSGNFSWGSEAVTRKTRILDVVYNASNNELVRTKTIVKNAIVAVDATPFKQYYLQASARACGCCRQARPAPAAAQPPSDPCRLSLREPSVCRLATAAPRHRAGEEVGGGAAQAVQRGAAQDQGAQRRPQAGRAAGAPVRRRPPFRVHLVAAGAGASLGHGISSSVSMPRPRIAASRRQWRRAACVPVAPPRARKVVTRDRAMRGPPCEACAARSAAVRTGTS